MLEAIRPLLLLVVLGLAPIAIVAPLLQHGAADPQAVEAARARAQREARRAARPTPRAMTASRRAELDAGSNAVLRDELRRADLAAAAGRHDDAIAALVRVLTVAPHHHEARRRLIAELSATGRWEGVEAVAENLLRDDAHAWEAWAARLAARRHEIGAEAFAAELRDEASASSRLLARALAGHPDPEPVSSAAEGLRRLGLGS